MSDNEMLYCLIAFILGWLASRHMGNGFSIGGVTNCVLDDDKFNTLAEMVGIGQQQKNYFRPDAVEWCSTAGIHNMCGSLDFCKIASE